MFISVKAHILLHIWFVCSDISEDGHNDGTVVDRHAVPRSVHVDGRRWTRGHSKSRPRSPAGASAVLPRRASSCRRAHPARRGLGAVRGVEEHNVTLPYVLYCISQAVRHPDDTLQSRK